MHDGQVSIRAAEPAWGSFSYAFGPIIAVVVVLLLALFLSWAFRRGQSVVAGPARPGRRDEYGLLTPIAAPATYVDGEILRRRLEDAGIRATLATTLDGPSLLVWPQDVDRARAIITAR